MYADQIAKAADTIEALAAKVDDSMLHRPTPCTDLDVAALLAHLIGLSAAFAGAGRKDLGPLTSTPPDPSTFVLDEAGAGDWHARLRANLDDLVEAWRDPAAWTGMTRAGGVDAPADILGTVALSELVLHGWDLARATGAEDPIDAAAVRIVFDFHHPAQPQAEREGMFGPVVPVPEDAPLLDRLAGLTGREPFWPHGTLEE